MAKYTHEELYGLDGTHFIVDLPFLQRRKKLLTKNLQKLVLLGADDKKIFAVNKAVELFDGMIEDIFNDVKIKKEEEENARV